MQYKRLGFTLFKFLSPTVHITTQFKLLKDNGYLINGEVILCFQFSYHYHLPHFLSLHSWFLIPFFFTVFLPIVLSVPLCLLSAYVYATSFFFSSFLPHFFPFFVAPAFFCGCGDFHQREEELRPCSVCHRHSSIFNQECICLKGALKMCVNV